MNGHVRPSTVHADWPWHWVRDPDGTEQLWTRVKNDVGQHRWYWIEAGGCYNGYSCDEAAYNDGWRYIAPCFVMVGQCEPDGKYITEPWRCN